jgi:uncharacterized SAM-binding protein YcdF (DUF218 family)
VSLDHLSAGDLPPDERRGRRFAAITPRRVLFSIVALIILAIGGVATRLFIVPASNHPGSADAIVVLNGDTFGERLHAAVGIYDRYPDGTLAISVPTRYNCPDQIPVPTLLCFVPYPSTTQGEARVAAQLAAQRGWTSMTVVTTSDQVWRARLRFSRCWSGKLSVVAAPTSIRHRIFSLPYEVAATVKAEVFQRSC